jgi:hypothetical protein
MAGKAAPIPVEEIGANRERQMRYGVQLEAIIRTESTLSF